MTAPDAASVEPPTVVFIVSVVEALGDSISGTASLRRVMATAARVSPDARQVVDIGMMVFVDAKITCTQ